MNWLNISVPVLILMPQCLRKRELSPGTCPEVTSSGPRRSLFLRGEEGLGFRVFVGFRGCEGRRGGGLGRGATG